jgi:hypothetical protein
MDYRKKIKEDLAEIQKIASGPVAFAESMGFDDTPTFKLSAAMGWLKQTAKCLEIHIALGETEAVAEALERARTNFEVPICEVL